MLGMRGVGQKTPCPDAVCTSRLKTSRPSTNSTLSRVGTVDLFRCGVSPSPVGSRAGAPAVGGGFPVPLFRLRDGFTIPPWPRFQPPPRQTQRADFPHCAFLLASHQGLWDLSCWERFRPLSWALPPVVLEQAQVLVEPLPTPPLPAE